MKHNFSCKNQEELNELLIIDFADFTQTKLFQVHVHSKKITSAMTQIGDA